MDKPRIDVFISSTSIDLPLHRAAVREAILSLGMFPSGMEQWPATGENPVALCRQKVEDAEIYIGIYAHRYGWRPEGYGGRSITELEYDWAGEVTRDGAPIPRLCFIMRDDHPWPKTAMESEAEADLNAFKARVKQRHVGFFGTPDDLKAGVTAALANILAAQRARETITWEAGARFDTFTLRALIGSGGNGQVWRADETLPDGSTRPVAIKLLRAGISDDPVRVERFRREISIMARIDHRHIARVNTHGTRGGQLYVVMPYLAGGTLRARMTGAPLPLDAALAWLEQIGAALDHVHGKYPGLIHRDVKPENILLADDQDEEGEALFLSDFGLVFSADRAADDRLTDDGKPAGTGRYMAPEQWRGETLSAATDRYALAIMAYELLTGALPFRESNDFALGKAHCETPLPAHPALPDEVLRILRRGAAKHPAERYASARAFLSDLRNWAVDPANLEPRIRDHLRWVTDEVYDGLRALFVELAGEAATQHARPEAPRMPAGLIADEDDLFAVLSARSEASHIPAEVGATPTPVEDVRARLLTLDRAVLIGEPGAGKTWMLQRLQLDLARAWLKGEPGARVPVLIRLNQYAGGPFVDMVKAALDTLAPYHDELLRAGRLTLLCDALNEMPRAAGQMDSLLAYLKGAPYFIVSCRVRDYRDDLGALRQPRPLEQVLLHDLELPAIRELVTKRLPGAPGAALWRAMRGTEALFAFWEKVNEKGEGERFWTVQGGVPSYTTGEEDRDWLAIHDGARLIPLARNPYMGDLLCRTFQAGGGALPDSRAALFGQFINQMLAREAKAAVRRGEPFPETARIEAGLEALARALQERAGTVIAEAGALEALASGEGLTAAEAPALLRAAADANILASGDGEVRFSHQLLQEYFAARVLLGRMEADEADGTHARAAATFGAAWWEPGVWRETTVILGELLGERAVGACRVARWLAPVTPDIALNVVLRNGAGLTLDDLDVATRAALIAGARGRADEVNPAGRAAAYRVLGLLGADARRGIALVHPTPGLSPQAERGEGVPDVAWCLVRAGLFLYGEEKQELDIPYDYWISQYPVTNAQFAPFVNGDGYHNRAYWTEAGWAVKEGEGWTQPRYWDDARWNIGNHPVVGVSWYEAFAYTCWLDALLRQSGVESPEALAIRLPTEQEWEKAARGTDGREYPWGDAWDGARCNRSVGGGTIGRTSAVGLYSSGVADGRGPSGAADMAGNIWEWCLTRYYERNNNIESDSVRVLRGGSWFDHYGGYFRAAFRDGDSPNYWDYDRGFRLARSLVLKS